jgi:multidrug efflux pump subunit AcrA (membrane-fusion protein)
VQLHYYRVTAPSSGIVGDIPVRVSDRVTTTTVLTTVDKPGSLEAYIYVPIERVAQLKSKLPVQIVDQSGKLGELGWPPFMVHPLQPEFPC